MLKKKTEKEERRKKTLAPEGNGRGEAAPANNAAGVVALAVQGEAKSLGASRAAEAEVSSDEADLLGAAAAKGKVLAAERREGPEARPKDPREKAKGGSKT